MAYSQTEADLLREVKALRAQNAALERDVERMKSGREADDAIGMFLEFRDVHGYDEERARHAAVNEHVEGWAAREEIAAYETQRRNER